METDWRALLTLGCIDSALKLRLLLLFSNQPRLCSGTRHLSEWLCECPWAIEEALEALIDAGFLARIDDPRSCHYRLETRPEHAPLVKQLLVCDDHPLHRDEINELVRAANQERRFRDWLAQEYPSPETQAWMVYCLGA